MDEDEEIDIIGNYGGFMSRNERDIADISSGQLLSCDYTVHPKGWNENPDGENYWYESEICSCHQVLDRSKRKYIAVSGLYFTVQQGIYCIISQFTSIKSNCKEFRNGSKI